MGAIIQWTLYNSGPMTFLGHPMRGSLAAWPINSPILPTSPTSQMQRYRQKADSEYLRRAAIELSPREYAPSAFNGDFGSSLGLATNETCKIRTGTGLCIRLAESIDYNRPELAGSLLSLFG
jgi:hypothetical protein